jgi:predicted  nucleic acid-binding Zn-ribbon protein
MSDKSDPVNKGDRNKIYFLVVVIIALLGTNAYLFIKDKKENERFATVSTEKDRLRLEVEKIEVELDKVNALNLTLSEKLLKEQELARGKIADLKAALQKGTLTQVELIAAQKEVRELREFMKTYNEDILRLKKENSLLKNERDSLKASANSASERANELEKRNQELREKVKTGAALKAANVNITAYRVKSSGKNIEVTRASSAKKLSVKFDIAPNELAQKDYHKIYLRVFDPAGNLIANENNMFEADGQEMQFSSSTSISYNNDNTTFNMDWINPNEFIKGEYSIILYADGYTMGRAEIMLR